MTRRASVLLAVVLCGSLAASTAAQQQRSSTPRSGPATPGDSTSTEFKIGLGDVIEILVWNDATLSRDDLAVRPDGRISVPLLNDVTAAGLTPMQLRDVLVKGLSRYRSEPEVSVIVREIKSLKFSVMGQVKTPGRFDLSGRMTVMDALALAGGFTDFAKKDSIVVWRDGGNGEMKPIAFDYQRLLNQLDARQFFAVMPGDIIVVP